MRGLKISIYFNILFWSAFVPSEAFAVRKLPLFPFHFYSAHGGVDPVAGISCGAIGMLAPAHYGYGGMPVYAVVHMYTFQLRNQSNVPQTVSFVYRPGTQVSMTYSLPGAHTLNANGATAAISAPFRRNLAAIPANSTATYVMGFQCLYNACSIVDVASLLAGGTIAGPLISGITYDPTASKVCLGMDSTIVMDIEVAEDKGAITGSVNAGAGRGYGHVDFNFAPPPNFALNGGRPF